MTVDASSVLAVCVVGMLWWVGNRIAQAIESVAHEVEAVTRSVVEDMEAVTSTLKRIADANEKLAKAEEGLSDDLRRSAKAADLKMLGQ